MSAQASSGRTGCRCSTSGVRHAYVFVVSQLRPLTQSMPRCAACHQLPSQKERGDLCVRCVWYGPDSKSSKLAASAIVAVSRTPPCCCVCRRCQRARKLAPAAAAAQDDESTAAGAAATRTPSAASLISKQLTRYAFERNRAMLLNVTLKLCRSSAR